MFHFQVQKVSQPPSAGRPGGGPVWRDWNLVQTIGKAWHGRLGDREVDLYSKAEPRSGPVRQDRNLVPKIEDSWNEVLLPYTWITRKLNFVLRQKSRSSSLGDFDLRGFLTWAHAQRGRNQILKKNSEWPKASWENKPILKTFGSIQKTKNYPVV